MTGCYCRERDSWR